MEKTEALETWRVQSLNALHRRKKEIVLEKNTLDAEACEIDEEIRTTQEDLRNANRVCRLLEQEAIRRAGRARQLLELQDGNRRVGLLLELQAKNKEPNYEAEGVLQVKNEEPNYEAEGVPQVKNEEPNSEAEGIRRTKPDYEEANGIRYWHLMQEEVDHMAEMDAAGVTTCSHLGDIRREVESLKRKYYADHMEEYVEDCEEYVGGTELQDTFRSIYASKIVKTPSEDDDLRQFPQDLDDHENPAEANAEDGEEEGEAAWTYARQWLKRNGADGGIPKKYSPCVYFFKASHGCQKEEKCHFSHNEEIFCEGPFAALLKDLSWGRKDVKRFRGAPPPPPAPRQPCQPRD